MLGLTNEYIAMRLAKARQNELLGEARHERILVQGLERVRSDLHLNRRPKSRQER